MPIVGAVLPTPPIYHAAPPEVHSTLLNTGATAAGVTAAGTSWTQLATQYAAGIAELEAILGQVQATYHGPTAEKFVAAHQPMLMWMADVVAKATLAAVAHAEIAAAYTTAVVTMPTMPELITNHVVHGALVGTNFFGVNTIPIGVNEADYVRMWNQAAATQSLYDGVTALAVDSIPDTPMSPPTLIPGVGESGSIAATAAGFTTQGLAQFSGAALNAGDMMGSKLLAGKAATSPLSAANRVPDEAGQQRSEDMGSSVMQQFTSAASSAPQAAASAIQGPANMLMQAPQQLASAPQQLSSLLGQFSGGLGGGELGQQSAMTPAGFAGTGAMRGINPAGMTSLAGGALGTGPSRPLMPSTWGAAPTSTAESATNAARGMSPVGAGLPGAGAGGGGGGGGMMGHGANSKRNSGSRQVNSYSDDADDDEDADADGDWGMYAMTR